MTTIAHHQTISQRLIFDQEECCAQTDIEMPLLSNFTLKMRNESLCLKAALSHINFVKKAHQDV